MKMRKNKSLKKSKNSKNAKFFCESCGSEVSQSARFCNYCGKFFSSVRCPKCGKTGSTNEFRKGCPDCGYAVHKNGFGPIDSNSMNNIKSNNGLLSGLIFNRNKRNNSSSYEASLPIWVYVVSLSTLGVCLVGLYSCLV